MKVICALTTHKHFLISKTCWIFSILMFQIIILNNKNQLETYKIQLKFILVISKSKIVHSTYKLVILKLHHCSRVLSCFVCSSRSFCTCSAVLTTISFNHYPLVFIIYLKVSHNLVIYTLNLNQSNFHWLNQWFAFSLIHQWKKYFSLPNQSIFTEIISEIWLIYSNLVLAIWISQISLIISRFWLIQI